ncbi:hypothetical protein [Nocardia sp. NPDC057455]|uniref:hypothetical protein n=1 Tax=Nocardia sp. NPDC057455 TaxID=3346138 RepID=UPI00366B66A3
MSTAISDVPPSLGAAVAEPERRADLASAQDDLGYETARRLLCDGARARALTPAHRCAADRRPPGARPPAGVVAYGRGSRTVARPRARGAHPMRRVEQAQIGFAVLAVTALVTALIVVGLIALAHVRAGEWGGDSGRPVPVMVDGPGVPVGGTSR